MDDSLWVAAVEGGRLQGLEIDPGSEEVRWGSIYWARVTTIDASLDAAWLDLDGDNTGLLNNADVRIRNKDGTYSKGGEKAIGKVLKAGQMIAVQAKSAYKPVGGIEPTREDKSPRMSMEIALPGRYLIHLPLMKENQVSQRIRDKKLRKQLLDMMSAMDNTSGCILRSAAADTQTDVLVREGKILREIWEQLKRHLQGDEAGLIMLGPDAVHRILGDMAGANVTNIEIVTMERYQSAEEWCEIYAPDLVTRIRPVELANPHENLSLFDFRDINGQIEDLLQPYVILGGSGVLLIQETAALTAIDVNRGGDKGSNLAINIEAAAEIARQIRLRNLGGILIIDFLRLPGKKEEKKLLEALEKAFREDPCTVQIHGVTALGLYEITRTRRTPPLQDRLETAPA